MKTFSQSALFLSLALTSVFVNAGSISVTAPEIGIGSAALGIGLLTGFVALILEHRRK